MSIQELVKDSFDLASQRIYLKKKISNVGSVNIVGLSSETN